MQMACSSPEQSQASETVKEIECFSIFLPPQQNGEELFPEDELKPPIKTQSKTRQVAMKY